jgi:hypothetical protein
MWRKQLHSPLAGNTGLCWPVEGLGNATIIVPMNDEDSA